MFVGGQYCRQFYRLRFEGRVLIKCSGNSNAVLIVYFYWVIMFICLLNKLVATRNGGFFMQSKLLATQIGEGGGAAP